MATLKTTEMLVVAEAANCSLGVSSRFVEEIFKVRSFFRSPFHDSPLLGIHIRNDETLIPIFDLNQIVYSNTLIPSSKEAKISIEPKGMECLVINVDDKKIGLVCKQVRSVAPKDSFEIVSEKSIPKKLKECLPPAGLKNVLKEKENNRYVIEIDLAEILPIEETSDEMIDADEESPEEDDDFDISQYTLPSSDE